MNIIIKLSNLCNLVCQKQITNITTEIGNRVYLISKLNRRVWILVWLNLQMDLVGFSIIVRLRGKIYRVNIKFKWLRAEQMTKWGVAGYRSYNFAIN